MDVERPNGFDRLRRLAGRGSRDLRLLALATFCLAFGFGAYMATVTNFVVEVLRIQPHQQGIVESIREVPGFLVVLVAALTMRISEPRLAAGALALVSVGMAAYMKVNTFTSLVFLSLIWSVGVHGWMTLQPSMALSLSEPGSRGRRLGQLAAVSAVGTILGMALVLLAVEKAGMRAMFGGAGVVIALGAVTVGTISRDLGHKQKPRFVWKRRYSLYYTLTFLEGCRKQVFMTFAVFALVLNYGTRVETVAILMIINNVMNALLASRVGRLIDRVGERKVLSFCYAALIPVFIGYALIKVPTVLYVLYCLDSLFFLGSLGLNTYLHKIADPGDLHPSLAMGVSMNHAAAVIVPVTGGYLWKSFDYPTTFLAGAAIVAISVIMALRVRTPEEGPETSVNQ